MIRFKDGKVDRTYFIGSFSNGGSARESNDLADALDVAVAALHDVVMYLGPKPPTHLTCEGCEYEWQHALDAARNARKQIGADHAD